MNSLTTTTNLRKEIFTAIKCCGKIEHTFSKRTFDLEAIA